MFEVMEAYSQNAVIKVIGVGGGGGNAVTHMVTSGIEGVEFMCINTDAQALKHSKVKNSLQIGSDITKGLGAGANPDVGRAAALEDREESHALCRGSNPPAAFAVHSFLSHGRRVTGNRAMAKFERETHSINGVKTVVHMAGHGEPLVFFHGGGTVDEPARRTTSISTWCSAMSRSLRARRHAQRS